jgi:hypothetical protein
MFTIRLLDKESGELVGYHSGNYWHHSPDLFGAKAYTSEASVKKAMSYHKCVFDRYAVKVVKYRCEEVAE